MFLKMIIAAAAVGAAMSGFGTYWLSQLPLFVGSILSPTEAAVTVVLSVLAAIFGAVISSVASGWFLIIATLISAPND